MRRNQVLMVAILLCTVIIHLVFYYETMVYLPSLCLQAAKSLKKNNSNASVTGQVSPLNVHATPVSDKFRKAIPQNGAYWNRLLNSTMQSLDKGEYTFSNNDNNCSETNLEVLQTNVHDFSSYPEMHKEFLRSIKCRHPPLLIDQPHKCNAGEKPFLLFAIKSLPRNFERRQVVRETWGRERVHEKGPKVRRLFLLGRSSHDDPNLDQLLSHEASVFGDMLQWDFRDSLFNLTLKEHVFYKWAVSNCPHVTFIFKGDDDVFINTQAVITYLQSLNESQVAKSYVGRVITSALPMRGLDSKYYIPQTFYEGEYPPYVSGGGYLFSGALLKSLYYISHIIPFFPIDDAYTGMCFQALGISPVQHNGFQTFDTQEHERENNCVHKHILIVHQRTPQQIKRLWRGVHSPLLTC